MKLLKRRKAKNSKRGFYLQDKELRDSVFKPGTHFKYEIKAGEIRIVPSQESDNTVSKRALKDGLKPVIDIRDKKALSIFAGAKELEVEIFEDIVIVRGYVEEKAEDNAENKTAFSKVKETVKKAVKKVSNVIQISERIDRKKKFEIYLSKKQLEQAAGFQQFSIFDYLESEDDLLSQFSSTNLKTAIDNARIPLELSSLFSGGGFMDLGFQQAGFILKFALEMDDDAIETYRYNLGNHIVKADMNKFDLNRITKSPAMAMGNPCTAFTTVNRSKTRLLDHPDFKLVGRTIDAIKANENLKVFAWENVPQILTALDGDVLEEIKTELKDFEITYGVLNAADFGTPQLRRRGIILGSKIGKIDLPKPYFQPDQYVTVGQALTGIDDSLPNQQDYSRPKEDTLERIKHIPPGGNWQSLPEHLKNPRMLSGKTHSSIYRRLEMDKPSISLPNVRKSNILPPKGSRILSVRECCRLFGVPDNYVLQGKLSSMQQQICNAVAVPMARAIANVLKNAIQQFNIRNGFGIEELALV